MEELKKIALKGGLLIILLVGLNFIYKATFWEKDLEQYSGLTDKIKATTGADIIYLGDCSDSYFGEEHANEKGISQLLDSLLPNKQVATISEIGFHAGMYATILENIPENSRTTTIIVTMNLRSFSSQVMNTYVNNSINQRLRMLDQTYPALLNRFLLSFEQKKSYTIHELDLNRTRDWKKNKIPLSSFHTLYDWKTAFEQGKYIKFDETWTAEKKLKGTEYIGNYGFQIDTITNPRIKDFDKIVALAKERNWKLIFHLMPEKINEAYVIIGSELSSLIEYNRTLLLNRYHSNDVEVIDNMDLLPDSEFIEELPNAHFYYMGRRMMAERIKVELE